MKEAKRPSFERDPITYSALLEQLAEMCRQTGTSPDLLNALDPKNPLGRAHLRHMLEILKQNVALNTPLTDPLPQNHYVLNVSRRRWPAKEQIVKDFRHRTDRLENGITQRREWHPHNVRQLSHVSEDKTIVGYVHTLTRRQDVLSLIQQWASRGYIPGNEQELYALACHAHRRKVIPGNHIIAPGSFCYDQFTHRANHLEIQFYGSKDDFEEEGYRMGTNRGTVLYPGQSVLFVKPYAISTKLVAPVIIDEESFVDSDANCTIIEVPDLPTNELIRRLFVSKGFPSEGHLICPRLRDSVYDGAQQFEVGFFQSDSIAITFDAGREELARRGYVGNLRAFAQWGQSDLAPTKGHFISVTDEPQLLNPQGVTPGHLALVASLRKKTLLPGFISTVGNTESGRGWTFVGFREIKS